MKVSLNDGFELEISESALDDYELFDAICEVENGKVQKTPEVVRRVLGKDGETKLKDHLRTSDGVVKFSEMQTALSEIFTAAGELKK